MGKRRSRLSVKTGDKSHSKNLSLKGVTVENTLRNNNDDEDGMFDEVDAYHNRKEAKLDEDFVKFDGGETSSSEEEDDDGIVRGREQVLDLGIPASSSDEEDEESGADEDAESDEGDVGSVTSGSDGAPSTSSSDEMEDDEGENPLDSILDWGGKKRGYYGGDTGGLDSSKDFEDAYLEEQAAKEVQKARYGAMSEDDFFDSIPVEGKKKLAGGDPDDEYDDGLNDIQDFESPTSIFMFDEDIATVEKVVPSKNLATLSFQEKMRLLSQQSPELLPLTQHFKTHAVEQYRDTILIVAEQLLAQPNSQSVGTTARGKQYLRHKQMLLVSTMINVCMYLLLKMENGTSSNIKDHPVIFRLNQLQDLADKLRDRVEVPFLLTEQLETLSKAAALMLNGEINNEVISKDGDSIESDEDASESFGKGGQNEDDISAEEEATVSTASDQSEDSLTLHNSRNAVVEARYGVRVQDIDSSSSLQVHRIVPDAADVGDEEIREQDVRRARKKLSSTVNTISQKEKSKSKKLGQNLNSSGDMENEIERRENERLQSGFELMEQMLGKTSDEEIDAFDDVDDNEMVDHDDDDSFYKKIQQKSKTKKNLKESTYKVLPKYPVMEEEVKGERSVGRMIMKNRGLVPHKAKINRNPRVKKREQYRKALIRRKGAVREVRTEEAERYGGELTGIKANLSRSRKLGVR